MPPKENAPCYQCEKRYPGCHGKCEDYLAYHERREAALAEEHRQRADPTVQYKKTSVHTRISKQLRKKQRRRRG